MNEQQIVAGELRLGDQVFCGGETCNSRRWRTVIGLRMAARDAALAEYEWRTSVVQSIARGEPHLFSNGMVEAYRRLKVSLRLQDRAITKGAKARG